VVFGLRNIFLSCLILFILSVAAVAQEYPARGDDVFSPTVRQPVNLYDSFQFDEESAPVIRTGLYVAAPSFFLLYGVTTWGWELGEGFTWNPETFRGRHAVHGGADKYGHLYSAYVLKRLASFFFRASGSSAMVGNVEGVLFSELIMLGSEIGDGFSPDYGFDPYDFLFNNIGILIAFILDCSPTLDRIFSVQFEYVPSREMREDFDWDKNHDLPTDYGGTKYILTTKLAGIPYVSLTPLRYVNVDIAYYARGFDQRFRRMKTKNVHLGISFNYAIAFGDILPVGYTSSSIQTFFNYIHLPWDYEARRWKISEAPNENYEE
jgi:hypothetical protein